LETDQNDVTQVIYTLEPVLHGNLISQSRSSITKYYHYDGEGSTDLLTDSNGLITDRYLYKAYGDSIVSTGTTVNNFTYIGRAGYYFDAELLQYYLRARHYTPSVGRFLSRDPLGILRSDPNLYRYALSNPVRFTDPSGMIHPFVAYVLIPC